MRIQSLTPLTLHYNIKGEKMKVNLQKIGKNEKEISGKFYWENYGDEVKEEDKEWVEVRIPTRFQMNEIRKKAGYVLTSEFVEKDGRLQKASGFNENEEIFKKLTEETIDFNIKSWNILDETGKEIACAKTNKVELYTYFDEFTKWLDEKREKLEKSNDKEDETETKN